MVTPTTGPRRFEFAHIWLHGDRIACLSCGILADDIEFVKEDRPLCFECRAEVDAKEGEAP